MMNYLIQRCCFRILANFPIFSFLNMLSSLSPTGYMESGAGPLEVAMEKDKGKKTSKAPQGKENKDQMKNKFQGEPLNSKVTTA